MMTIVRAVLTSVAFLAYAGCAGHPTPSLTPMEIQALQTREYDSTKDIVFGSMISVFQDKGYMISQADKDTGLIFAESPTNDSTGFWDVMGGISKHSQTAATAFVEVVGNRVRVRLNFVAKKRSSMSYGVSGAQDTPILDAQTYQNAFEALEQEIFTRS